MIILLLPNNMHHMYSVSFFSPGILQITAFSYFRYMRRYRERRAFIAGLGVMKEPNTLAGTESASPEVLVCEPSVCPLSSETDSSSVSLASTTSLLSSYDGLSSALSVLSLESSASEISVNSDLLASSPSFSFHDALAEWALLYGVTHRGVNHILALLHIMGHTDLPRDRRTLLKTLRSVNVVKKCGGTFVYLGIQNGIEQNFATHGLKAHVDLFVNVDGMPVFESSKEAIWPILGRFSSYDPFLIALFHGESDPDDVQEYLSEFLSELSVLYKHDPVFMGRVYQVRVKAFICDAPARSLLRGTVKHNGYHGCERCESRGAWHANRVIHEYCEHLVPRTHDKFAACEYIEFDDTGRAHQMRLSPILRISNIDIVKDFILDSMHLVYLGICLRVFNGRFKGK